MTDTRADTPSVASLTRPVTAGAPVVSVRFLGNTAAFVLGLIAAPLVLSVVGPALRVPPMPGLVVVAVAGLLVGFGTRLGNGCTSGHGICGIARLSPRSIAATLTFMLVAMLMVAIARHAL